MCQMSGQVPILPVASARHCAVPLLDDRERVFLYGGAGRLNHHVDNPGDFDLHLSVGRWSGLSHVYSFAQDDWHHVSNNHEGNENHVQTELFPQINETSPCNAGITRFETACALRIQASGRREVVVPTFDGDRNESCTAILDVEEESWHLVRRDNRDWVIGGKVIRLYTL